MRIRKLRHLLFGSIEALTGAYAQVNGSAPDPFQTLGDKFTLRYTKPFTVPAGKRTIKAVAVSRFVLLSLLVLFDPIFIGACEVKAFIFTGYSQSRVMYVLPLA
jgi:hypothetical protein